MEAPLHSLRAIASAVGSALLLWIAAGILILLLPDKRLGSFERAELQTGAFVLAVAWAAFAAIATLRSRRAPCVARAFLLFAVLAVLPLCKESLADKCAAGRLSYPAWLFASLAGAGALFLRVEASALLRRAGPLAWVALASAGLVLGCEAVIDRAMVLENGFVPDEASALGIAAMFAWNAALVLAFTGIACALLNRPTVALVLAAGAALGLAVCDVVKLAYLKAPLHPLDLLYVHELSASHGSMLAAAIVAAVLVGVVAAWCWRLPFGALQPARRATLGCSCAVLLVGIVCLAPARTASVQWDARRSSLENGLFLHLLVNLRGARVTEPEGYGRAAVERIVALHADGSVAPPAPGDDADVIVLVVESLMDPLDLTGDLGRDPLPFLHELAASSRSGDAIVPSFGSQSANTEFELLTGLSMRFLPAGSLPYEQFVRRELPALPRVFAERGHRTVAILADPPAFYDRTRCYPLLGFEEVRWLDLDPDAPRALNGSPSDEAMVDAILEVVGGPRASFVFAFTNATHAPYGGRPGVDPDGIEAPTERARRDLAGYADALGETDRALRRLVDTLRGSSRRTVVAILGDHLPPFAGPGGVYEAYGFFDGPTTTVLGRKHGVPVLIASDADRRTGPIAGSVNYLGLDILAAAGLEPGGHWAVLASLRRELPIVSRLPLAEGARPEDLAAYELLQYDLLFGERYVLDLFRGSPAK